MQVQFYLPPPSAEASDSVEPSTVAAAQRLAQIQRVCQLCASLYRQSLKVFVYCANQQDAELVDEVLWQFDAERFVPHNLAGEGPQRGAPIEISWQTPKSSRQVLVNLTASIPTFANRFVQIIEFVPVAEALKTAAREKYKHYRQLGVTPETINAS